jgi:sucrose synthase
LQNGDRGTMYRLMADRQGLFIHFAQFESFGRTILEAMISGLPSFATQFGGGSEIIQDGDNGFHINPTDFDGTAKKILQFLHHCESDPAYWKTISDRAMLHIQSQYNWTAHAQQILLLTKIYSFWHYIEPDRQAALHRYLEALFYLLYKPRSDQILAAHMQRS